MKAPWRVFRPQGDDAQLMSFNPGSQEVVARWEQAKIFNVSRIEPQVLCSAQFIQQVHRVQSASHSMLVGSRCTSSS